MEEKIENMKSSLQKSLTTITFLKKKHEQEIAHLQEALQTYNESEEQLVQLSQMYEMKMNHVDTIKDGLVQNKVTNPLVQTIFNSP